MKRKIIKELKDTYKRLTSVGRLKEASSDDPNRTPKDAWKLGGEYRNLQDKFKNLGRNDVVPIVNAHTHWDYEEIASLVHDLLVDANFHSESEKVYDFMMQLD